MNWKSRSFAAVLLALLPVFIVAQELQPKAQAPVPADAKKSKEEVRPTGCVCALYRYAQYPGYSSYYSKRCIGSQVDYVSYDTIDIGAYPNPAQICNTSQDCQNCSGARKSDDVVKSSHDHEACDPVCKKGLDFPSDHEFKPILKDGAIIIKEFIARVNLSKDGKKVLYAKVFQIFTRVPDGDDLRVFGTGVETRRGGDVIVIDWDDVTPIPTPSGDQTHCIRFRVAREGHEHLVLKDTEFQVITHIPVPLKKAR